MKKGFIHHNGLVQVHKEDEGLVESKVRPKIYVLKFDMMAGTYFLQEEKESYNVGKIYGTVQSDRANRIVKAFKDSDKNLGVLLSGTKGTGKTVLIKLIANTAVQELNLPVITINQPYFGDNFNSFIEDIGECVILFDEFTKVYRTTEEQEKLLTLFDGLNSAKRLCILTSNEPKQVSQFFIDRPGRILYHFEYTNLDRETLDGYIADKLEATHFHKNIIRSYENATMFSFDMLQTLVKECNMNPDMEYRDITMPLNITELRSKRYYKFISVTKAEDKERGIEALTLTTKDFYDDYDSEESPYAEEILLDTFGSRFNPGSYIHYDKVTGFTKVPDIKPEESMEDYKNRRNQWMKDKSEASNELSKHPIFQDIKLNWSNFVKEVDGIVTYTDKDTGITLIVQEVWR